MITFIHRKTKINNEQSKTLYRGSIRCKKKRRLIYTKEKGGIRGIREMGAIKEFTS